MAGRDRDLDAPALFDHPSLAGAVRFSVSGLLESLHVFLAINLALVVVVALVIYALSASPVALLLVPFLAPLVCGLARPAAMAARGIGVSIASGLPGVRHRFWMKVGVAVVQCLLLLLATTNIFVAPAIGGLIGAVTLGLSIYLTAAVLAYATILWPLIVDPEREDLPLRQLLSLAMMVFLRRPFQALFLLVVVALSAVVVRNLVAPAFFLPSMVLLLVSAYVIPAADELRPADHA